MKARLGVIMILACVASFFLYNYASQGKREQRKEAATESTTNVDLIDGVVVEKGTNEPLIGVTISVSGYNPTGLTKEKGLFYIEAQPTTQLIFKKEGYKTLFVEAKDAQRVEMEAME